MRIDHVAHPCRDPEATHRFYSGLLGLTLTNAFAASESLMLIYALPDGGSLVFTAGRTAGEADREVDSEKEHAGLSVATRAELDLWCSRLEANGVKYRWVDNERIYFSDPNGLVLEIEVASPLRADQNAYQVMKRWLAG
ncbi:MAG TPA: VOC family protein [Candidatus Limnocylindrales bacterium]|nr:VOC family protein [Candidatus Limnocylindrales bacterium]